MFKKIFCDFHMMYDIIIYSNIMFLLVRKSLILFCFIAFVSFFNCSVVAGDLFYLIKFIFYTILFHFVNNRHWLAKKNKCIVNLVLVYKMWFKFSLCKSNQLTLFLKKKKNNVYWFLHVFFLVFFFYFFYNCVYKNSENAL